MIIKSLLDTDLYKFTMGQVVFHKFSDVYAEYTFKCRDHYVDLKPFTEKIKQEIQNLCQLRFTREELNYLKSIPFLKNSFIEFLRLLSLDYNHVQIYTDKGFELKISGPWFTTIYFEVPILAIINEIYFSRYGSEDSYKEGQRRLDEKIQLVKEANKSNLNFLFSDFGTRRRFSGEWQEKVVSQLAKELPNSFFGTSNVKLAMEYRLRPIGTMAHEFLQGAQALVRLSESQKFAFQTWADEYRGDLGIVLSDVVGMDAFFRDFDLYFAKLFDGARHDSGDPFIWCDKLIQHYETFELNPKTKTAVFSDGLDFPKAIEIAERYNGRIRTLFGIGTNLTNDLGHQALNIVIKLTKCNYRTVAKISDSEGKQICEDINYLNYLKSVFKIN